MWISAGGSGPLFPFMDPGLLLLMFHQSVWTSRISVSSSCSIGFKAGSTWFLPIRGIPKRELLKRLFPIGRLWRLLLNDISLVSPVGVLNWISRSTRETRLVLSSVCSDTWVWYPFNVVNGSIHVVSTGTSLPDLPTRIENKNKQWAFNLRQLSANQRKPLLNVLTGKWSSSEPFGQVHVWAHRIGRIVPNGLKQP